MNRNTAKAANIKGLQVENQILENSAQEIHCLEESHAQGSPRTNVSRVEQKHGFSRKSGAINRLLRRLQQPISGQLVQARTTGYLCQFSSIRLTARCPMGSPAPQGEEEKRSGLLEQWLVEEAPGMFSAYFWSKSGEDRRRGSSRSSPHPQKRGELPLPSNPRGLLGKVHPLQGPAWPLLLPRESEHWPSIKKGVCMMRYLA